MSEPVLTAEGVTRTFRDADRAIRVLDAVDLTVAAGATVAVSGSSGCGKSTLLHLLGGLDRPSEGSVRVGGEDLAALSERRRGWLRNRYLGFVYQFHHLMPELSARENVMMPLLIRRLARSEAADQAQRTLERVGLGERLDHKPAELSGGERQRTAIARAVVAAPRLVLADEPTGNLDEGTARHIHELMLELNRELGTALVVVTHEPDLAGLMDSRYHLAEGRLERLD